MIDRRCPAERPAGLQPLTLKEAENISIESERLFAIAFLFMFDLPLYHEPFTLEGKVHHHGRTTVARSVPDFLSVLPDGEQVLFEVTTQCHVSDRKCKQRKVAYAAGWKHRYIHVGGQVIRALRPVAQQIISARESERIPDSQRERYLKQVVYGLVSPVFAGQVSRLFLEYI